MSWTSRNKTKGDESMAGQMTVYPVSATTNPGGTIHVIIRDGKLYNCNSLNLRPRNKDIQAVLADIRERASRGDKMRIGDMSWSGEGEPWFFEYREKIAGQKRATPDPDRAVLRHYEQMNGVR